MFYEFNQNNSGGSFDYDPDDGISLIVIVEADSVEDACERAERIGLYFNGVAENRDCACCGDRWHDYVTGDDVPSTYGVPLADFDRATSWLSSDRPSAYVHLKDGRVFGFHVKDHRYVYLGDPTDLSGQLPMKVLGSDE